MTIKKLKSQLQIENYKSAHEKRINLQAHNKYIFFWMGRYRVWFQEKKNIS